MKENKFFVYGMLAMVLALGLAFTGCTTGGGEKDALDGTTWGVLTDWGGDLRLTFNSPDYEERAINYDDALVSRGVYSISGNTVTFKQKITAVDGELLDHEIIYTGTISDNTISAPTGFMREGPPMIYTKK